MPNSVTTRVNVIGDFDIDTYLIDDKQCWQFDFNKLIKMPDHIRKSLTDQFNNDRYDWAVNNWGTKWNAYNTIVEESGFNEKKFSFDTAWAFPLPVMKKLVERWKVSWFQIQYADTGTEDNCGAYVGKRGILHQKPFNWFKEDQND